MDVQSARDLFAYSRWANRLLLEAAGQLSAEEFDRDLRASFGSIKGTLRHLLWGERGWLGFWRDGSFSPDLSPASFRTFRRSWPDGRASSGSRAPSLGT